MANLTYSERQERIKKDDGDPEDMVWRSATQYVRCYHEDPECPWFPEERLERPRGLLQEHSVPPCKHCVLGEKRSGGAGTGGKSHLQKAIEAGEVPDEILGGAD